VCASLSCRSPVGHGKDRERADYAFSFIVSGASSVSGRSGGRLILPTATRLTVSLRRSGASADARSETVAISSGLAAVPVTFDDLETGTYTVAASAYADPAVPLFSQIAEIELSPETESVVLNLVPCDAESVAAESADAVEIPALAAGAAKTWRLAAGSRVLAARSLFLRDLNSDALVFVQAEDGTLIVSGSPNRLSLAGVDLDEAYYLTVYAGASAQSAARAFPGPVMLPVPAGAFQRDGNASNISSVSAFSLARLETTRELYAAVMGADPSIAGYSSGMTDPVNNVSWYQAIVFCNKLSLLEGLTPVYSVSGVDFATLNHAAIPSASDPYWNAAAVNPNSNGYRLPSDMEWMWAAMGATSGAGYAGGVNTVGCTRYFAGSNGTNSGNDYAWHYDNSGSKTHPTGTKLPNELGFHDMMGNVREICGDWFVSPLTSGALYDYPGPPSNADAWGSWLGTPCNVILGSILLTDRESSYAYDQEQEAGFRVARSAAGSGYIPRDGLVGEWLFNVNDDFADTSITAAPDGTAPAGYVTGADRHGRADSSLILEPDPRTVVVNTPAARVADGAAFSVSLWFNADDTNGQYPYLASCIGLAGQYNWFVNFYNGTVLVNVGVNNETPTNVAVPVLTGSWYHLALVYDGATLFGYLNGVLFGSAVNTHHSATPSSTDLVFGGGQGAQFDGTLDDARLYSRALTATEVQRLAAD
jgi:formylglycine-generating enzyme required for sulfatase activity